MWASEPFYDTIMQRRSRDFQIGLHNIILRFPLSPFPRLANQDTP